MPRTLADQPKPTKMINKKLLLALTAAILIFSACEKEADCDGTVTKNYELTDFRRISAGSALQVTIRKGTAFSIAATGCNRDIEDLRVQMKAGQTLAFDFKENRKQRDVVKVDITLPYLIALNLSGAAEGVVSGFANAPTSLRLVLSGASSARIDGTTIKTQIELSGASRLRLSGNTEELYGGISGGSELRAFDASAKEIDLSASGGAQAYVTVQDKFIAEASGGSRIVYKGNPGVKETATSGGGQIVQE